MPSPKRRLEWSYKHFDSSHEFSLQWSIFYPLYGSLLERTKALLLNRWNQFNETTKQIFITRRLIDFVTCVQAVWREYNKYLCLWWLNKLSKHSICFTTMHLCQSLPYLSLLSLAPALPRKLFTSVFLTPYDDEKGKRMSRLLSKEAISCHVISRFSFFILYLPNRTKDHLENWTQSWTKAESTHNRVEQRMLACRKVEPGKQFMHVYMLDFHCFHSFIGGMIDDYGDCNL